MRRVWIALIVLAALAACDRPATLSFVERELARKGEGQVGPRYAIAQGKLPTGFPWLFVAYRRAHGQICMGHAWLGEKKSDYQGACTFDDAPQPQIQNEVSFQDRSDTEQYMYGIVKDERSPKRILFRNGSATQDIPLIRNEHFPGELFYIDHRELPSLPETVELLDASGTVIVKVAYQQGG
jgi:hypothetical protein